MTERVLLAGCGDLGMRVAQRLLARGDEVWALRRSPVRDAGDGLRWLRGDLIRPESLRELPAGITRVVYAPTPGARDEAAYRAIFVDGLQHLLDALAAAPLQRVLFVSSSAVYGEHVFTTHTSCSLLISENADPAVRDDLERWFGRAVPDGDAIFQHDAEGPDDMPAHVRSILTGVSLTLPVHGGKLLLGTWQGLYLWEHRLDPHQRKVTVTVLGH